ncbi:LuxR C-terminal-related transcriptional regulator [Pseudogracilibacillus auburnensis]|uniref:GAF domain-containing protein n=1 Tax=Pseudogracilibacillus auburnensis TaxID=1494959 RepID=A0A2V3W1C8_9BACI|nr:LuxR C-terminal-related transcriptional regulator [Pseudogracilibacillus auburnensis]PXW82569.1 GAF domain-containing protein [Pseudogracilibacillus auburnensis]
MTLTLDHHMDTLFQHGLEIIRANEASIHNEWAQMKEYFQKAGKRSAKTTVKSVHIFSKIIFNYNYDKETLINKIKVAWKEQIGENPINQFIMTLLESSVHHATKTKSNHTYKDYQAIQLVFTKISEQILSYKTEDPFSIDTFLQHLVYSQQLPIEWVAVVLNQNNLLVVDKWFNKNQCLLNVHPKVQADNIYTLTELLLRIGTNSNRKNIITIPFENVTLLFCIEKKSTTHIMPFISHALQLLQSGKMTLKLTHKEQQWKDAVIMFNEAVIRARTFSDALEIITEGFVNYLPFERCAIFSYSQNDEIGFGLSGHRLDTEAIKGITEEVSNLPLINDGLELLRMFGKNMKYLQPLYIPDAKDGFPEQYINQFQLKSLVVAPIFTPSRSELIGAAILDQGANKKFEISRETYTALIKFGQSAGEILGKFHISIHSLNETLHFSPREIEVLKLMAEGESTTSAAGILHLSEYTVRDYITAIMQKMKARNRTEAVARAIRKGVI